MKIDLHLDIYVHIQITEKYNFISIDFYVIFYILDLAILFSLLRPSTQYYYRDQTQNYGWLVQGSSKL